MKVAKARKTAADRLEETSERIMKVFVERVRSHIKESKGETDYVLRNSLPVMLKSLEDRLRPAAEQKRSTGVEGAAREHAEQRVAITDFSLSEVLTEYHLIRQVLFEILREEGPLTESEADTINDVIDRGIAHAGQHYTEVSISKREATEEQFRLFVKGTLDYSILMLDNNGNILTWNEGAQRITGYEAKEILGKHFSAFYGPEDVKRAHPQRELELAAKNGRYQEEGIRFRKDGSSYIARVSITALYDEKGSLRGYSKVTRDVTEQIRAEKQIQETQEQLTRAKEAAEAASEAKSSFLANMSHEIRTPLAAIMGFSRLLREPSIGTEERDHFINTITRNGDALTRIIDDILDLAKVEAGKLVVEQEQFSVFELMSEVTDLFRDKARQKGIYLLLDIEEDVPAQILTDPARVRQIMINLIGNAVKFTFDGGVRVCVTAERGPEKGIFFSVEVKDTGIGLSSEQRDKLFKPFVQADSTTTRQFGGTGLGLALSQRLATALGGEIRIKECAIDKGCTFVFKFRATLPEKFEAAKSKSPSPTDTKYLSLKNFRVLVADDSPDNLFLVKRALTKSGAIVDVAHDGKEAIELAMSCEHDVVLMDIQMPNVDGYQALRNLRAQGYKKPIIAVTAHAMSDDQDRTIRAGFAAHIAKPLTNEILLATVLDVVHPTDK